MDSFSDFVAMVKFSQSRGIAARSGLLAALFIGASASNLPAQSVPVASVATPVEYGAIGLQNTRTLQVAVTNTGSGSLTISPSINGPSYKVFGATPTDCLAGTATGQTCTLNVEFSPVTVGPHDDNLTLTTNGASNPVVRLKGTANGIGTEIEGQIYFPTIPYGTTVVQAIEIHNVGLPGRVIVDTGLEGPSFRVLNI